jgi:MarR family transcriptional regulator, repressor for mepA
VSDASNLTADTNVRALHRISNELCKIRNQRLAEFQLTAVQSDVVIYLSHHQEDMAEINQLDIQAYLQLSNPTVSGILNRLEEKDFITRRQSTKDARFKCVLMTQKALKLAEIVRQQYVVSEELLVSGMSDTEKSELSRLLILVLKNLDAVLDLPDTSKV